MNRRVQLVSRTFWSLFAACLLCLCVAGSRAETSHSLNDYLGHLSAMGELVRKCKANTDACQPAAVGSNEIVNVQGKDRLIDYGWLRDTLKAVTTPDAAAKSKAEEKKRVNALLDDALQRLRDDSAEASAIQKAGGNLPAATPNARPVLQAVLASSEFHNLTQPSLWNKFWQRFFAWLDERMRALNGVGSPSRMLVRVLTYGSILVCVTLLVWWYVRQVRQQRIILAAGGRVPHPSSASAVDWQQRLQQAQALAAAGDWRGGVHLIYWAAISRLEALGNWPADRARTPREYMQLLPASHRKRKDLVLLTRNFERIWYGHLPVQQDDFEDARNLLERLVAE